jgi:hypothetical protein
VKVAVKRADQTPRSPGTEGGAVNSIVGSVRVATGVPLKSGVE